MWVEVDTKSDRIDMWQGVSAASLSQLGIRGHRPELMLPIGVHRYLFQRSMMCSAMLFRPAPEHVGRD